MKLSKKWLNDYVEIDVPEREYAADRKSVV